MRLLSHLLLLFTLVHSSLGFVHVRVPLAHRRRLVLQSSGSSDVEALLSKAARLRAEAAALQETLPPRLAATELVDGKVEFPLTLLDSCWRIQMVIRGKKDDANLVPVNLSFDCKFCADDNVLHVVPGPVVRRGYIWAPEAEEGNTFLAFDVEVKGLGAVPDGKLYLNARVKQREDKRYALTDGIVTIKEVLKPLGGIEWIFSAAGILAEFKVVGLFSAAPLATEQA